VVAGAGASTRVRVKGKGTRVAAGARTGVRPRVMENMNE
jgi:hypothetical protein